MYHNGYTYSHRSNQMNAYLAKEIMDASPQQLLIKVYDFAIVNCQRQNIEKTNKALQELINALRFDTDDVKEISLGLLKLYQFCQEEMRNRNFDIVLKILMDLRESWRNAFNM